MFAVSGTNDLMMITQGTCLRVLCLYENRPFKKYTLYHIKATYIYMLYMYEYFLMLSPFMQCSADSQNHK